MIAFVDSSVILRLLFSEPAPLKQWRRIDKGFVSRLLLVEVGRVIDRVRLLGQIDDREVAALHAEARRLLASFSIVSLDENILGIAAGSMPTVLGTLDTIHLATALEIVRAKAGPIVMATHDRQLATASQAFGLEIIGA